MLKRTGKKKAAEQPTKCEKNLLVFAFDIKRNADIQSHSNYKFIALDPSRQRQQLCHMCLRLRLTQVNLSKMLSTHVSIEC